MGISEADVRKVKTQAIVLCSAMAMSFGVGRWGHMCPNLAEAQFSASKHVMKYGGGGVPGFALELSSNGVLLAPIHPHDLRMLKVLKGAWVTEATLPSGSKIPGMLLGLDWRVNEKGTAIVTERDDAK